MRGTLNVWNLQLASLRLQLISASHSADYEGHHLPGCDAVLSGRNLLMFLRNILHPSLEPKSKSHNQYEAACLTYCIFSPECGDNAFLRNVGELLSACTLSPPRREWSSMRLWFIVLNCIHHYRSIYKFPENKTSDHLRDSRYSKLNNSLV